MFRVGFEKRAMIGQGPGQRQVNPITAQDALGASKAAPFSKPISRFASGHHPRLGLKAMSKVRRGA